MYLDAMQHRHKAEDVVAIDRVAALGQLELQALHVLVYHQHIIARLLARISIQVLEAELLRTVRRGLWLQHPALLLHILVDDLVYIQRAVGYALIEVGDDLITHALDELHHDALIPFYLTVLHLALQLLLGQSMLARSHLLERLLDFHTRLGSYHIVEPSLLRCLRALRHDLHLIAAMQHLLDRHILAIHASTYAATSQLGVNQESKVEHCSTFRQLIEIALWREDEHLILIEIHLELIHSLHVAAIGCLQCLADRRQPGVQARLLLDALVAPVSRQATLGDSIHALCAYLHLHPLALRSHHGDVQTLIAIALRHREPVAQAVGVGLVHIRHDAIDLPALLFLLIVLRIQYHTDGEEVIYTLEGAFLLLHLLVDGVDALGTPFDVELQSCSSQFLFQRLDERVYVGIAALLGLVELILDVVVDIMLRIFQAQVFQLRFQHVETQLMRQWGIEIRSLVRHLQACLCVLRITYLPHDVHTVGYHDENHAHILCEGQQ